MAASTLSAPLTPNERRQDEEGKYKGKQPAQAPLRGPGLGGGRRGPREVAGGGPRVLPGQPGLSAASMCSTEQVPQNMSCAMSRN